MGKRRFLWSKVCYNNGRRRAGLYNAFRKEERLALLGFICRKEEGAVSLLGKGVGFCQCRVISRAYCALDS